VLADLIFVDVPHILVIAERDGSEPLHRLLLVLLVPVVEYVVIHILQLQLSLRDHARRRELLIRVISAALTTFDKVVDVVVQDLEHVLLVDYSILDQKVVGECFDTEDFLEFLLLAGSDESESNLALVLVGEQSHDIHDVLAHEQVRLGAALLDESDEPRFLRRDRPEENVPVHLLCHFDDIMLREAVLITKATFSHVKGVGIIEFFESCVHFILPLIIEAIVWVE